MILIFDMAVNAITRSILTSKEQKVKYFSDDSVPVSVFFTISKVNPGMEKYTQAGMRNR